MKLKRIAGLALVLAAIAAAVFLAFRPQPVPVDLTSVRRGPLRVTIDEEGETRIRERYRVSAPLTGRLQRIGLEPGDAVRAGQTVAVIEPVDPALLDVRTRAEAEAQVKAADAALGQARANSRRIQSELEFARSELARLTALESRGVVSKQQVDAAQSEVRSREEALEAARFAIEMAAENLEMSRARLLESGKTAPQAAASKPRAPVAVRAPVSGVILRRLRESEAVVPAGEPLLEIGDPSHLEIVSDLLSTDAVKIRPGDSVLVEDWGGEQPLHGRVRRIEPSGFTKISALGVEEQRVNVLIDLTDPKEVWASLGDGFRVEVRVIVWEKEDVLKVPVGALFRHGDQWAVFEIENGKAALRPVEIGRRNGLEAEVLSGVSESARVVDYPGDQVRDGVDVVERSQ